MTRGSYVTRARLEGVAQAMNERQHELLAAVARLGVASGTQLRRLHYGQDGAAQRSARRDLGYLIELRVLGRIGRRIGGRGSESYVYSLDVAGQQIVQPGRRRYRAPWRPLSTHLQHALAVSDLYVALRQASTEDSDLVVFDTEPACWRRFYGFGGAPVVLKPDAFVIVHGREYEDRFFIELDRATESTTRITDKAGIYIQYWEAGTEQGQAGVYPLVVWVVPDSQRSKQIFQSLGGLSADHRSLFAVVVDANVTDRLLAKNGT